MGDSLVRRCARRPFAGLRLPGAVADRSARIRRRLRANAPFGLCAIVVSTLALLASATVLAQTVPDAPQNVRPASHGNQSITLLWDPAPDNGSAVTGYQVRHAQGTAPTGAWTVVAGGASAGTYPFTGLAPGTSYTIELRALNGVGAGPAASFTKTTVRPPWQVRNLTATPGNGRVLLGWERPSSVGGEGAVLVRYEYRRKEGNDAWGAWQFAGDPNSNGRVLTGLDNGTRYSFQVRAVNQGLAGADGSPVSAMPAAALRLDESAAESGQGGQDLRR